MPWDTRASQVREFVPQKVWHLDGVAPLLPRICLDCDQFDLEQIAALLL